VLQGCDARHKVGRACTSFVLDRSGRVHGEDRCFLNPLVHAVPRLIAQGPDDDAAVVAISLHHANSATDELLGPSSLINVSLSLVVFSSQVLLLVVLS
jgi:hypothetical protein